MIYIYISCGNDYHSYGFWKITILNGKIHEMSMAIFHGYVKLPEGNKGVEHVIHWEKLSL